MDDVRDAEHSMSSAVGVRSETAEYLLVVPVLVELTFEKALSL